MPLPKHIDSEDLYALDCLLFPNDQWSKAEFDRITEKSISLVAYDKDRLIGYVLFRQDPQLSELMRIGISETQRRRGLAEGLIKTGLQELRSEAIFLTVRLNNVGAISLYRKFGFTLQGIRTKYYRDDEDGLVFVRWKI